jgi:membrane protease YdiL (CAAX protease family)
MIIGTLFILAGVVLAQVLIQLVSLILPQGSMVLNGIAVAIALLVVCAGYALYVQRVEHRPLTELALRHAPGELGTGVALGLSLIGAVLGGLWLLGVYQVTGLNDGAVLINALARNVPSAVIQDLILLGLIYRLARAASGPWPAAGLTALPFGLLHLFSAHATFFSTLAAILAGLLLIAAFQRTDRLWLAFGIHSAWDFGSDGVFGVGASDLNGSPIKGLLEATVHGPALLTGGEAGVQASVPALVALGLTALVLLLGQRGTRQGGEAEV